MIRRDKPSKILDYAADLIVEYGWIQKTYGNEDIGFCAVGAMSAARTKISNVVGDWIVACERVSAANPDIARCNGIVDWNDRRERTRDEVVRTLRKAAKT